MINLDELKTFRALKEQLAQNQIQGYEQKQNLIAMLVRAVRHTAERAPLRGLVRDKAQMTGISLPPLADSYIEACLTFMFERFSHQLQSDSKNFSTALLGFVNFITNNYQTPDEIYQTLNQAFHAAHAQNPQLSLEAFKMLFCEQYRLYEVLQNKEQGVLSTKLADRQDLVEPQKGAFCISTLLREEQDPSNAPGSDLVH